MEFIEALADLKKERFVISDEKKIELFNMIEATKRQIDENYSKFLEEAINAATKMEFELIEIQNEIKNLENLEQKNG